MGLNRLQELGLPSLHFHNMHAMDSAAFTKAHSDSSFFKKKTKNGIVSLLLRGFPRYNKVGLSYLERSEIVKVRSEPKIYRKGLTFEEDKRKIRHHITL